MHVDIPTLLRKPDVCRTFGTSNSGLRDLVAKRLITEPVKLTSDGRCVGFPAHEVSAVVKARIAGKSDAEIKQLVQELHAKRTAEL